MADKPRKQKFDDDEEKENLSTKVQKIKNYLVLQYLLQNTDENHPMDATKIAVGLSDQYKIAAERRSIYKDINDINKAIIAFENNISIFEAEEWLKDDIYDTEKFIVYDKSRKGFYARNRNYDVNDIRLLAECVYSAKFLEKSQTDFLIDILCRNVSTHQAKTIKHDVLLTDRVRADNAEILNSISIINDSISTELNGEKHTPEKISFKYLTHTISNIKKKVERGHGKAYVVSPYALLINDGYYYLLAYESNKKKFINYRVDRMKKVELLGEERDGEDEFLNFDMKSYTQRVFFMYSGKETHVTLRFINPLLDSVIDRLGKKNALYSQIDKGHFTVTANVEVSPQFYGWICGFGNQVKILSPDWVVEDFKKHVDKMRGLYE